MNKTLVITTIALVAVVMGMSAIAPVIPVANAAVGCPNDSDKGTWQLVPKASHVDGDRIDRNGDGLICFLTIQTNQGTLFAGAVDNRF